ncbi:hypothetical protein ACFQ6N_35445 [Kitasatospora sp. NPDC056446]|uniref:hypothetical protein n=1 Tax=Kitasatospora sp. NPDC056446 TaxID=3345819 RepID=UPI003685DB13
MVAYGALGAAVERDDGRERGGIVADVGDDAEDAGRDTGINAGVRFPVLLGGQVRFGRGRGGGTLADFYAGTRLLDGDTFYVAA